MDFMRLMLVLACMAPLFILMAIRGIGLVPWEIYFPTFISLALIPNAYLALRIIYAIKQNDRKRIRPENVTDNREQLITYIFAMLLPLFQSAVTTIQDLYSALCALLFVVYIFGNMEIYYMNFFFSLAGYRVLSIRPNAQSGNNSVSHVLITKKNFLAPNIEIQPIRITDFLLFDK
ncbi:hypothetical protein DFR38_101183 [Aquitalea magnusonii]|uniref:Uncharacterized protein n=2 Tax=Aquitalea magnusonii TaxID=332411 RepID=A0A318JJA3_9NEIS|nr:hypothetical protein DFR38_101183 [Aquitalea magnusonii]